MSESNEELTADILATLDQLLQNADALKKAKVGNGFTHEVDALEKTQESLLARLMHRQSVLELDKKKQIMESIRKEALHEKIADYAKSLKKTRRQNCARVRKARSKS